MRCCCCPISFFISRGHHVALATGIFLALYTAKIGRTHVHVRCWLARCSSPGIFFQFYSVFVQTVKASSYLFFRIVRPRVKIWAPCASQCVALFHPLRIVRTAHFRILKIKSNKAPSIRRQSSLAPPNWTAPVVVNLEIGWEISVRDRVSTEASVRAGITDFGGYRVMELPGDRALGAEHRHGAPVTPLPRTWRTGSIGAIGAGGSDQSGGRPRFPLARHPHLPRILWPDKIRRWSVRTARQHR
jgi:hypothetical protein